VVERAGAGGGIRVEEAALEALERPLDALLIGGTVLAALALYFYLKK
jgi:hypothetical protein